MTTKTFVLKDRYGGNIPLLFTDNGDGTYTLNTSGGGGGGGGGGSSISNADTVWVDPNGGSPLYYIRQEVDNAGTITYAWVNIDGTAATPTVANLAPFNLLAQSVSSVDLGVKSDTVATTDTGTFSLISLFKRALGYLSGVATAANQATGNAALTTLHNDLIAPLPAGTNAIGAITNTAFQANAGVNLNTSALALETGGNLATVVTNTANTASKLPTSLGVKTSANALAVVLASDQAEIPVSSSPPQLLSQPASLALAALNAAVQWQVEGGLSYYLTLANAAAATAQFVGTVTFQYSLDGATWSAINGTPVAGPTTQAGSTTSTVGLWMIDAPAGSTVYLRATMTAYTSGSVNALLVPGGVQSAVIPLPWTYTVTTGNSLVAAMDVSGVSDIAIQISAITTTVLTAQGTNDPSLTTWDTIPVQEVKSQNAGALTITAAGTYRMNVGGYKWFRLQCTTTGTVLTVQGVIARLGASMVLSSFGNSFETVIASGTVTTVTTVTTVAAVTSLSQIAAKVPLIGSAANGSTNFPLGVSVATAVSQLDQSATAFAGSGSVLGTVVASAQGGGAVVSSEINVSALTLGTASAVYLILQESRGGTNFTDIWTSDPITATGIQSMPAIPVAGRRRWRAFNVGGTSTTVTVTITSLELPSGSYPLTRQARDAYAATNPLASMFNTAALTASNFVLGTLSSSTTAMYVEGCKTLQAFMTLAGSPTVTTQPVVAAYGSMDGTNFVAITGATMTAAGNGTYGISITNNAWKFVKLQVTTAAAYSAGSYTISNIGVNGVN